MKTVRRLAALGTCALWLLLPLSQATAPAVSSAREAAPVVEAGGPQTDVNASAATASLPADPAAPDTEEIFFTQRIRALMAGPDFVTWSTADTCTLGGEFIETCIIRQKPAGGGPYRTLYSQTAGPSLRTNPVSANGFVYWASTNGQILRLPNNATPSTTPFVLSNMELMTATARMAVDSSFVY